MIIDRRRQQESSTVLAVFAHPDDESFRCGGTLALLARRGVQVQTLTATRGGGGSRGEPPLCTPEELPSVREAELRCACQALGIESPRVLDYEDRTLNDVDHEEGMRRILDAVDELRPQAIITWPPHGLSGHPDHMAVSRWARLAFQASRALGSEAPVALYHIIVPESVAKALGFSGLHATPDKEVSLAVDVTSVWEQKLGAIRCHRTQAGQSPVLDAPDKRQRLFLGKEHFQRVKAREMPDILITYLTQKNVNSPEDDDE